MYHIYYLKSKQVGSVKLIALCCPENIYDPIFHHNDKGLFGIFWERVLWSKLFVTLVADGKIAARKVYVLTTCSATPTKISIYLTINGLIFSFTF